MLRREGRLDHTHLDAETGTRRSVVLHHWERPILLIAAIAVLIFVGIAGMDALIGLFP